MHANNFVVNECGNRHAVKHILELLPQPNAIPIFALVVKPVNPVNLATLVVAPKQEEVLFEFNFVGQQQNYCFKRLLTPVDIVTKEKIVCLGRKSPILKQSQQVRKLPVDIT
jgi:hypothetical protein